MKKIDIAKYSVTYICFILFIIITTCLSGKCFVHIGDGYVEYYPIYLYIGEWIREFLDTGRFSFFDFSIGYGEDIIGALNYFGLGDPINILSCFVRDNHAYYMFLFGIFIRLYLAGLGMLLYLEHKGLCGNIAVASSFIYAFSVFSMVLGLWFYPFLNALYLFPICF